MSHDVERTSTWLAEGTKRCQEQVEHLDETAYQAASALPGWTRKHLVAHVAANAEALGRLLHWARTGEATPMYSSPQQRGADIEAGAELSGDELTAWYRQSAEQFAAGVAAMPAAAWQAEVVTAQGRTVPGSEVPWLRTREVMVHAVDLATGVRFADLPEPFLIALRADILTRRGHDVVPALLGDLPEVTAYLAGRHSVGVTTERGLTPPALPPWL